MCNSHTLTKPEIKQFRNAMQTCLFANHNHIESKIWSKWKIEFERYDEHRDHNAYVLSFVSSFYQLT